MFDLVDLKIAFGKARNKLLEYKSFQSITFEMDLLEEKVIEELIYRTKKVKKN